MNALPSSAIRTYTLSSPPPPHKAPTVRLAVKCKTSAAEIGQKPEESKNITVREKTQSSKLLNNFFNSLDDFICRHIDPPMLPPIIDPKVVLAGNFAPVNELPPTACKVTEGALPPALDGAYIRNGPNPQFAPRGPHHLFDGDGMLHCIRISGGRATLCSRFVKTYKYTVEREIGSPVVINYFSAYTSLPATLARYAVASGRVISGQYNFFRGTGNANTSVASFGGKLFALAESDLPYRIGVTADGDVITLGRHEDYGQPLESMTAHPKVDPETGEVFAFRHNIQRPFLTYFRIGPDGIKHPEVSIFSKKEATLVHDFAITENYAVFPDSQIVIRPAEIVNGNQPAVVDQKKMPRLGIIPRYAADERGMWWLEVPGLNMVHAVNAWEEDGGEKVVMVAPNVLGVENLLYRPELTHSSMERVEINLRTKAVVRRPISTQDLEFAAINPSYVGKKTRYMYAGIISKSSGPKMVGVVKLDLSLSTGDCTCGSRVYGPGCYGGEPCFVPRNPDAEEEDDGYVVSLVHDESTQESKFIVMDAKSANLDIVAVVKLPQRVPYGFHGIFINENHLQKLL